MILFEVTDGFMGESYSRCMVWARDLKHARAMMAKNPSPNRPSRPLEFREVFRAGHDPFATRWSDSSVFPGIDGGLAGGKGGDS